MIGVIGYGMGNLRSVLNAIEYLGADCEIVETPKQAQEAEKLVLPGVGAFGEGMRRLDELGFVEALSELCEDGRPLLGICLGMQLLADASSEHGEHAGLGLVSGRVGRIETDSSRRIPHVGWNSLTVERPSRLFANLGADPTFYFVHSFEFRPTQAETRTATTDYGVPLTATVERGAIYGVQFHPEKSQADGLALLRSFIAL